jgi:hypothetical protein
VTHDHSCATPPRCASHRIQSRVEFNHAFVDEFHPTVTTRRQRIQNPAVEYEGTMHPIVMQKGVMERSVIETAQIAPEPDKGGTHGTCLTYAMEPVGCCGNVQVPAPARP